MGAFLNANYASGGSMGLAEVAPFPSLNLSQQFARQQAALQASAAAGASGPSSPVASSAGASGPSSPVASSAGAGTASGAASGASGVAPAPGQQPAQATAPNYAAARQAEENALRQTYLRVGQFVQGLPSKERGGLNVVDLPLSQVPASALEAEGYNLLEKFSANELGGSWDTENGTALNAILAQAPQLTPAERAALGPGIANAYPFGPGIGNTPGSGVYNAGQYGGNGNLETWIPFGPGGVEQNMWDISNVIPGTIPDTFYGADEFGNVDTGPFSSYAPGTEQPSRFLSTQPGSGYPQSPFVPPTRSVTNFGGDQPLPPGSATPAWMEPMLSSPLPAAAPPSAPATQWGYFRSNA